MVAGAQYAAVSGHRLQYLQAKMRPVAMRSTVTCKIYKSIFKYNKNHKRYSTCETEMLNSLELGDYVLSVVKYAVLWRLTGWSVMVSNIYLFIFVGATGLRVCMVACICVPCEWLGTSSRCTKPCNPSEDKQFWKWVEGMDGSLCCFHASLSKYAFKRNCAMTLKKFGDRWLHTVLARI